MNEKTYIVKDVKQLYTHLESVEFDIDRMKEVLYKTLTEDEKRVLISRTEEVLRQVQYYRATLRNNLTEVEQ